MTSRSGKRLLMSSVIKPFGMEHGDGFGSSYEGSHQLMWAQGIFRPRATTTQWGIDFIAENLEIPTTCLHYPTLDQFIAEVKKGYDYVGIAFIVPTMHKMLPMVEAVRRHAPETEIILGGYGTMLGDELEQYADHICRGEGVRFMRELLGEDVDAPITQPLITQTQTLFSLPIFGRVGYVFAGLGCPNGCDFCVTSHYFGQKHIKFLRKGSDILGAIVDLRRHYPDMVDFWINDEDFLLAKRRGKGFLEAIRETDLPPLNISIFSSVKALSKFTPTELVEMGIDWVWVGYEAKGAGYQKMEGKSYEELFRELKRHGISVLASMIIGYDYHTPEIIRQEFEELMALRPSMTQYLIYGPANITPLYAKLDAEGRIDPEVMTHARHKQDGFTLGFKHPNISRSEMSAIQRELYHEDFRRLGPAVFRVLDDWLQGYITMKDSTVTRARQKARFLGDKAHAALAILPATLRYLEGDGARFVERLAGDIERTLGPKTLKQRLLGALVPAALAWTQFALDHDIGQQPEFTRRTFRQLEAKAPVPFLSSLPGVRYLWPRLGLDRT